ncbi:bifunctional DNA primase/polymerase [Paenibacillus sophorae]|nr:bifunctional DNA primase/polymerase [Paenibacillus sophorae]
MGLAQSGFLILPVCSHDHSDASEQHRRTCNRPGKAPLISDWKNRATNNLEQIETWFNKRPNSNAGLVLGTASRIVAIDVDGDFGRAKLEELSCGDLPPTWRYPTPGGGERYLYQAPPNCPCKKKNFSSSTDHHEALELLGDGQYTVIPGSVHPNGGRYAWAEGGSPDDLPLAPAPDWMARLMNPAYITDHFFDDDVEEDASISSQGTVYEDVSEELHPRPALVKNHSLRGPSTASSQTTIAEVPFLDRTPTLQSLTKGCRKLQGIVDAQSDYGCSEDEWFTTASLLSRAGAPDEAQVFSEASNKHSARSEARLAKIATDAEAKSFGPPRCAAFGCSEAQVKACFGSVRLKDGLVFNSPAELLRRAEPKPLEVIESKLAGTPYRIKGGKVGDVTFDKNGEESFRPIANFVAFASSVVLLDDGAEKQHFFKIEGLSLDTGKPLRTLEVRQDAFEAMNWIFDWGMRANLEPGLAAKQKMRHLTQLLSKEAETKSVYAHLGFRQFPEGWRYLHGGGCVGKENVEVRLDKRLEKYVLPEPDRSLRGPIQASLNLLNVAKPEVTMPLLAAVFLSPLCEALRQGGIEPAFLLWLYGVTGTRKSTLSALFLSHFGPFTPKSPPASFKDTANSLEKRAFDCKDSLLWIDDFHPSASSAEARKMEQIAQFLIRSYGDRVGRGRMKADSSLRTDYAAKGIALVTGEQQIDGHSSNARVQGVELRPRDIDLAKLTIAQRQSSLLAHTMAGYVAWVGERMSEPGFVDGLRRTFHERRDLALPGQSHGRLAENAAWLFLGWDTLLEFAVAEGALMDTERQDHLKEGWSTLLSLSEQQSEQVLDSRPGENFLSIVGALLHNGSLYTLPANAAERKQHEDLTPRGTHVGWHDKKRFFFLPDVLYNEVSAFLSKQQEQIPLKKTDLWRQLQIDGLLEPEVSNENGREKIKRVRRKVLDGSRIQTIWIKRDAIVEGDTETEERERSREAAVKRPQPRGDLFET